MLPPPEEAVPLMGEAWRSGSQTKQKRGLCLPRVPVRYGIAALLIMCQLLCAPLFSVTVVDMSKVFHWSKSFQGHTHSAFFLGYAATGLPGGILSDMRGGKWVLFLSYVFMGLFVVLTPWAASMSSVSSMGWILLASRVFMGMAEGVQGPTILSMVSTWIPKQEQSTVLGAVHGGMYTGSVIGFILAPLVISHFGWESVWYVFGCAIFLWCAVWAFYASNSPREHHLIGSDELRLIEGPSEQRPVTRGTKPQDLEKQKTMLSFVELGKDGAVWAIIIAHFAHDWCWYVAVSWLPTYFVEAHELTVQMAALYSAAPFLTQLATTMVAGATADWLSRSGRSSRLLAVRRASTTIGFLGSASFLVLSQWQPSEQPAIVMLCFCAAFGFDGMHVGGYLINAADIAPEHAGCIKGLGDTAGCIAGFSANVVVGIMSHIHGSFYSTFLMLGIVQLVGAAAYFCLADAKPRFGVKGHMEKARSMDLGDPQHGAENADWGLPSGNDESGVDILVR